MPQCGWLTGTVAQGSGFADSTRLRTAAVWFCSDVHAAILESQACKHSLDALLAQARLCVPPDGSMSPVQAAETALQAFSPDGLGLAAFRLLLSKLA